MKLYYSKGACSLVVRITIHEMQLTSSFESVDLKTKKTETGADFLTINPKGSVPTLVTDNNQVLTENAVILQYLADTNKAYTLLPEVNHFERYRVLEWLNFITTDLHKNFGMLFNAAIPGEIKEEVAKPLLKKKFSIANQQLKNHKYLMGDHYTLPDGYLFVMLMWAMKFRFDFSDLPELTRYFDELKNRKSIAKSLKEEELSV